ncbi:MAG TPA: Ger(x)C family spore germination C-terminal domain-containing protein, partial [Candidatus Deferrimicrobium sp.]|nr:Ger(x)C family spore germination C-terminal domain-containing protein [Candidatus Deferrimicrobium sp.]
DVSIEFGKVKQRLTAKLNNKRVVVNLKVSINGSVGEQIIAGLGPKKSLPLGDSDFHTELGDLLKDKIKADLMALIKKSQTELGVDIFGVGNYLSNRYPNDWNLVKDNWPEYYTNAVFNLEVKAAVKGSGTIDLRYPAIE